MAEITSGDINGKKPSVSTGVKKKPKKSGNKPPVKDGMKK